MKRVFELLPERSRLQPAATAYLTKRNNQWTPLTWSEVEKRVDNIAAGLVNTGLAPREAVSILGTTRLEWALSDLAVLRAGGVSIGIYPTLTGEQSAYILRDSGTKILFVENAVQLNKMIPWIKDLPDLRTVILWDAQGTNGTVLTLDMLEKNGVNALGMDPLLLQRQVEDVGPSDPAIIIYTSGTTGPPKGAILSHKNIMAQLRMLEEVTDIDENDRMMFFLPLSHVGERIPGHYNRIYRGVSAAFVEDISQVLECIKEIKPTVFGSVPRIFEKAYSRIQSEVKAAPLLTQRIFTWADRIGREASRCRRSGEQLPLGLRLQHALADKLVFKKIRNIFGGKVRYFLSSSAPIAVEIIEFFHGAGMLILEGYGQTEMTCFCTLCRPDAYRFGSVGKPLPGVELKIADDGEILVRGDLVFLGYQNQPELTRETITDDGWIHSGDLGRLDADGFLWITGRKKDIIITSGGKNITPSNIENLLKNNPLIEQALVHGDRRNYLTALIGVAPEETAKIAKGLGLQELDYESLTQHPAIRKEVQRAVDTVNAHVARYETIKKFVILRTLLTVDNGELTPTLKIRRRIVEEKYRHLLDALYTDG